MNTLLTIVVAAFQLQTSVVNPEGILSAALERFMPTSRPPGALAPTGRADRAKRKLFLDVVRTTEAFRALDPLLSPDYAKIGRPFVARARAEAIPCSGVPVHCAVADDGVYAAITSVKADSAVNSYRIELLLLSNGYSPPRGWLTGTETEMFISLDKRGEWKVDRIGKITAIN
jgi:hypothetical protein